MTVGKGSLIIKIMCPPGKFHILHVVSYNSTAVFNTNKNPQLVTYPQNSD